MVPGTAVITGASSGLGLQCARAHVATHRGMVLAVRDPAARPCGHGGWEPNRCSVLEVDTRVGRSVRSFRGNRADHAATADSCPGVQCRPAGGVEHRSPTTVSR